MLYGGGGLGLESVYFYEPMSNELMTVQKRYSSGQWYMEEYLGLWIGVRRKGSWEKGEGLGKNVEVGGKRRGGGGGRGRIACCTRPCELRSG